VKKYTVSLNLDHSITNLLIDTSSYVCIKHFGQHVVGTPVDAQVARRVDWFYTRLIDRNSTDEGMSQWIAFGQLTSQSLCHSTAQRPRQVSKVKIVTCIAITDTLSLHHVPVQRKPHLLNVKTFYFPKVSLYISILYNAASYGHHTVDLNYTCLFKTAIITCQTCAMH